MKNFYFSLLSVVAVMTFAGCQVDSIDDGNGLGKIHSVSFVSNQFQTKTEMIIDEGKSFFFWDDDDCKSFSIFENGIKAKEYIAENKDGIMKIYAEFNGDTPVSAKYSAYLNNAVSATQSCDDVTYDRSADILVSEAGTTKDESDILTFAFRRIVAISQMTIKGMTAGETVSSVALSSDKPITGDFTLDTENNMAEIWSNDGQTLTITPKDLTVAEDGTAVVNFITRPVTEAQLTITVTTSNGKKYTKEFSKPITFKVGAVKVFGVTVAEDVPAEPVYEKVTSEPTDWSGEYLLVYESSDTEGYCWTGVDAGQCHVDVTISNNVIAEVPSNAVTLTIAPMPDGYSIMINGGDNDGKYIGKSSYANGLDIKEDAQINNIEIADGSAVISGAGNSDGTHVTMRYNKASGNTNERFRYYKSGQEPVQLYKYTGTPSPKKQPQILSFPQESYEINLGETFSAPTVTGAQTTVAYSSSNEKIATVNETSGAVTIIAAGEVTITAIAEENDTYKQGLASYTLTVIDPYSDALTTIEQIYNASTTAANYKVIFDNWVVSGVKGSNAYVTDGTNGFIIYKSDHGFEVGDVLSGMVYSCALKKFNGSAEFTNITTETSGLTVTKGGTINPVSISIADLSGLNTGAVISFDSLNYNEFVFSDGVNTIKPYNAFITLPSLINGLDYKVTGVYIQYNATKEIAPRSVDDIVEIAVPKYTVSVAKGITNGTVTVDYPQAAEGQTVTITATPASGYKVKSISAVKTASSDTLTLDGNKFIMPAEAVTVSAEFEKSTGTWTSATMAAGTNGSTATVNKKDAIKVGASKVGGDMTITVPSGATKVKFYAAAWNGVTGLSLNITPEDNVNTTSVGLTADTGIANNSPFTLNGNEENYKFEIELTDISDETTLTLRSSTAKRFVVWGAEYFK